VSRGTTLNYSPFSPFFKFDFGRKYFWLNFF